VNSKTVRILTPGLALGAALLAGAILAAERPADLAGAPEQVRVRLVSAMAKWRGCLLRAVETRRAEGLGPVADEGHNPWPGPRSGRARGRADLPGNLRIPSAAGRAGHCRSPRAAPRPAA
jgi:hypothetical protein